MTVPPRVEERYSFLIHRINAQLARICNPRFRRWKVDIDMARLLALLDQEGSMAVGDIVRIMALPQSTISHQLMRLMKLGYLIRAADPRDSRASIATLTPQGQTVARESNALSREVTRLLVEALEGLDAQMFRETLKRMDAVLTTHRSVDAES